MSVWKNQTVDLEKITLVRGFCDLLMTESTGEQVEAEMSTVESMPWEGSGRDGRAGG